MNSRHENTAETWRERRIRERHNRLRKTANRDNGCLCDTGPVIVATWRGPFSTLTVALEHRHYCPIPDTAYDPDLYATTGQRIPIN